MTYSYTQISQYLSCPRRYKHRYLDGWKEKDTRAAMMFGRAFEQAVAAYFERQDAAAVLYREWAAHRDSGLHYSERDNWDRMLQSGVQLLDRFAQDDRIRIPQPRRNSQIKFTNSWPGRTTSWLTWMLSGNWTVPLPARVEDHRQPLPGRTSRTAGPRPSAGLLFLDDRHCRGRPGGIRPQAAGRDSIPSHIDHQRAARRIRPSGPGHDTKDRIG